MAEAKKNPAYLTAGEIRRLFAVIESPRDSGHIPVLIERRENCHAAEWTTMDSETREEANVLKPLLPKVRRSEGQARREEP